MRARPKQRRRGVRHKVGCRDKLQRHRCQEGQGRAHGEVTRNQTVSAGRCSQAPASASTPGSFSQQAVSDHVAFAAASRSSQGTPSLPPALPALPRTGPAARLCSRPCLEVISRQWGPPAACTQPGKQTELGVGGHERVPGLGPEETAGKGKGGQGL